MMGYSLTLLAVIYMLFVQGCATALIEAVKSGDLGSVKAHLAKGADVNAVDTDGKTALHKAAWSGRKDIVELLLAKGAKYPLPAILIEHSFDGHVSVFAIVDADGKFDVPVGAWRLSSGYYKVMVSYHRSDYYSSLTGRDTVEFYAKDSGIYVLNYYIFKEEKKWKAYLTYYGPDGIIEDASDPLRVFAVKNGYSASFELIRLETQLLLEENDTGKLSEIRDIDINATDSDGKTILMLAAEKGNIKIIKFLIDKGTAPMIKDNDGMTALAYAAKNGHDEIVKLLEQSAKTELDYAYLALYYGNKSDYKKAKENIEKAVKINPNNSDVWFIQGNIFYKQKDYDNAIIAYKKTVEINPKGDNAWKKLALCYKENKDYKRALEDINKAVELSPEDYEFRYYQGEIYLLSGDITNSGKAFDKALELVIKEAEKEQSADKYGSASWCALLIPKFSDAESYAKKGLELDPNEFALRTNLGHAYLFQGKKTEAIAEYRKFIDNYKDNPKDVLKDDFSLLKKRYPDKSSLIEWAEGELGKGK